MGSPASSGARMRRRTDPRLSGGYVQAQQPPAHGLVRESQGEGVGAGTKRGRVHGGDTEKPLRAADAEPFRGKARPAVEAETGKRLAARERHGDGSAPDGEHAVEDPVESGHRSRNGWWDPRLLEEFRGVLDRLPEDDERIARASEGLSAAPPPPRR